MFRAADAALRPETLALPPGNDDGKMSRHVGGNLGVDFAGGAISFD
jgi:hypothetical protein